MGQITIDFPTLESEYKRHFTVSGKKAKKISTDIENLELKEVEANPAITQPTTTWDEGIKAGFGMWADREETGEEIAMNIRKTTRDKDELTSAVQMPKAKLTIDDFNEVLGMWANRKETGEAISRRIREGNRRQK